MTTYDVTITATITKTIRVEAENVDEAIESAHEQFTPACTDINENYQEDTDSVVEVMLRDVTDRESGSNLTHEIFLRGSDLS